MLRYFAALCFLASSFAPMVGADEPADGEHCDLNCTELRLYFAPEVAYVGRGSSDFRPEIARLYVDDVYVGDAIVNLDGFVPSLRFPKSKAKIRIEMAGDRRFETEMAFLGHGSSQVLYVSFGEPKTGARSPNAAAAAAAADAATTQPFGR